MYRVKIQRKEFFDLSKTILNIGSITYAMKARKILTRVKIVCEVVKINASDTKGGCSYGIKFRSDKIYDVAMQLKNNEIQYEFYSKKD